MIKLWVLLNSSSQQFPILIYNIKGIINDILAILSFKAFIKILVKPKS